MGERRLQRLLAVLPRPRPAVTPSFPCRLRTRHPGRGKDRRPGCRPLLLALVHLPVQSHRPTGSDRARRFTDDGLPIGLQIVGRRLDDALVLRASAAFEAASRGRTAGHRLFMTTASDTRPSEPYRKGYRVNRTCGRPSRVSPRLGRRDADLPQVCAAKISSACADWTRQRRCRVDDEGEVPSRRDSRITRLAVSQGGPGGPVTEESPPPHENTQARALDVRFWRPYGTARIRDTDMEYGAGDA